MRHHGFETPSYRFINYVEMTDNDSRTIWELRNHPLVSIRMVNNEIIPYYNHQKFISGLAGNTDKDYFVIKDKNLNIIGSVNIDYSESPYPERGIFINPAFFNNGHAYNSMKEFYEYANSRWGLPGIMTKVKIDNAGSNRLEEKLGALLYEIKDGYNFYNLSF